MRRSFRVCTLIVPSMANHWLVWGLNDSGHSTARPAGVASARQQRTVSRAISGGPWGCLQTKPLMRTGLPATRSGSGWLRSKRTHSVRLRWSGGKTKANSGGSGSPWGRLLARSLKEGLGGRISTSAAITPLSSQGQRQRSACVFLFSRRATPSISKTRPVTPTRPWKTPRSSRSRRPLWKLNKSVRPQSSSRVPRFMMGGESSKLLAITNKNSPTLLDPERKGCE